MLNDRDLVELAEDGSPDLSLAANLNLLTQSVNEMPDNELKMQTAYAVGGLRWQARTLFETHVHDSDGKCDCSQALAILDAVTLNETLAPTTETNQ